MLICINRLLTIQIEFRKNMFIESHGMTLVPLEKCFIDFENARSKEGLEMEVTRQALDRAATSSEVER